MAKKRAQFKAQGLNAKGKPRVDRRRDRIAALTQSHLDSLAAERERRESEAREKNRQVLNLRALHESDERTKLYREEKEAGLKRHEAKMAEAKAAWNRMLDDLRESGKGGRPRKTISIKRDPANALVEALERGA